MMELNGNIEKEESSGAGVDGYAEQETESRETEGDSKAGSENAMGAGSVYFVESPDGQFIKIGYTKLPVVIRMKQIGQSIPGLRLIGHLPGTRDTEAWLHVKFAAIRSTGEWFTASEGLRQFIAALGPIPPQAASVTQRFPVQATSFPRRPRIFHELVSQSSILKEKRLTKSAISLVMSELGRRGSAATNGAMTPEQRKERATKAAKTRWGRRDLNEHSKAAKGNS